MQRSNSPVGRILRTLLLASLAAASGGCFLPSPERYDMTYEVRRPKAVEPPPLLSFDFVSDHVILATFPRSLAVRTRTDGDFVIYSTFAAASDWDRHWAIVVGAEGYRYETFVLPIDLAHRSTEWSPWRKPDSFGAADPRLTLMGDQRQVVTTAEVPPDCFEVRYRFDPVRDR